MGVSLDDQRLSVLVKGADGRITRWGPDEADPFMVPFGLQFGDSIPGGFKDGGATLARPLDRTWEDMNLLDEVVVQGPGGEVAWEGRMAGFPASWQTDFSIGAQLLGHAAQWKDNASLREIYADGDLSHFVLDDSVQRKINLAASAGVWRVSGSSRQSRDPSGTPGIVQEHNRLQAQAGALNALNLCECWYDAQGIPLDRVYYDWLSIQGLGGAWTAAVILGDNDTFAAADNATSAGAASFAGYLAATTATRKAILLQLYFNAATAAADALWIGNWRKLRAYGRHGLPRQLIGGADPGGFYGHDIAADIMARTSASLVVAQGAGGVEPDLSFIVPQLAFFDPVDGDTALSTLNAMFQKDWGVWEGKRAFWKSYDQNADVWELRRSEGATLDLAGDQADDLFNGVVVRYNLPDGTSRTAGPTGYGPANITDPALLSTDPNNPANTHGLKRWGVLSLSNPTTDAGAVQIGRLWLLDKAYPQRRGTATVTGTARHATKGERPAWALRSGSTVRFLDHSADVYRKVIDKRYDDKSRVATLTLDNTAFKLDAILERIGVQLADLVLGQG